MRVTDITMIDNFYGVTLMSSNLETNKNEIHDSVIVGDTDSHDSICDDKFGLHLSSNS